MAQKNRANMLTDIVNNIYNNLVNFITGQNAQDRFVNLLDSSPNILSDKDQPNGYVGTNSENEMLSAYYNEEKTRTETLSAMGSGELVPNKFYQVSDAVGATKLLQVCAESAFILFDFALDVNTGETGVYDINTDVFTAIAGSGNTTTTPITAAALLALQTGSDLSTTTIYVVTDAPLVISIMAESVSQLSQTGTVIDANYSGTVYYDVATNTLTNGIIFDTDENTWIGCLPTDTTLGASSEKNTFYQGIQALLIAGSGFKRNTLYQRASSNTFGDDCVNNTVMAQSSSFIFGDNLRDTTIEAGLTGADYTASPDYDFLYNNTYPSTIFSDGADNYHSRYDPANDRIVLRNLTTLAVSYIGGVNSDSWASTEVTGNLTAAINTQYINTANATYTDPSPVQAKGFKVYIRNGTATIGGVGYSTAGSIVWRVYHSGAWATYVIQDKAANDAAYLKLTGGSLSGALNEAKGADIASATTTDIGAATGNYVVITGTTTITGLGTVQAGTRREVNFSGILTLTHNGTSLILPTGANITTAAGDTATFISLGSGNWVCINYQRASGAALVGATADTYAVFVQSYAFASPADSTSYHFGIIGDAMGITTTRREFKFTKAGNVTEFSFNLLQTNNGSGETVNIYLRNTSTATDTSIGTFTSDFGASGSLKTLFSGLSIAVNTTDNYVIKITTPAWSSNPTAWIISGLIQVTV